MIATSKALELIKEFEGLHLKSYKTIDGCYAIGYGHRLGGSNIGVTWTENQSLYNLNCDVCELERDLSALLTDNHITLNQNQFDALVVFAYQCGLDNVTRLINLGIDTKGMANKMKDFSGVMGVPIEALQKRRKAEIKLFNEPVIEVASTQLTFQIATKPNYYMRRDAKATVNNIVGNTVDFPYVTIVAKCGEWVQTTDGYLHENAFYDIIR